MSAEYEFQKEEVPLNWTFKFTAFYLTDPNSEEYESLTYTVEKSDVDMIKNNDFSEMTPNKLCALYEFNQRTSKDQFDFDDAIKTACVVMGLEIVRKSEGKPNDVLQLYAKSFTTIRSKPLDFSDKALNSSIVFHLSALEWFPRKTCVSKTMNLFYRDSNNLDGPTIKHEVGLTEGINTLHLSSCVFTTVSIEERKSIFFANVWISQLPEDYVFQLATNCSDIEIVDKVDLDVGKVNHDRGFEIALRYKDPKKGKLTAYNLKRCMRNPVDMIVSNLQ